MRPEDIGELVECGEPRVSPDGTRVVFVVTTIDLDANRYVNRLWLADVDGSSEPRPLSPEGSRDSHPRWSPDGRLLAFVRSVDDDDEDGGSLVSVVDLSANGRVEPNAQTIAPWPDSVDELEWSPDGTMLAFAGRVREETRYGHRKAKDQPPRRITTLFSRIDTVGWTVDRRRHVLVVPADGSAAPRAVTEGPWDDGGLSWSPDGRKLAFTSTRHDDWDLDRAVDLFVVDVAPSGSVADPTRLTGTDLSYASPSWSPDGRRIAVTVSDEVTIPSHSQQAIVDIETGQVTVLTAALDRQCAPHGASREPVWDGEDIWFTYDDGGNVRLARVTSTGGDIEVVVGGDRWVTGFDVRAGVVAFCVTTPTELPELRVIDGGGNERGLSRFGRAFAEARALAQPERFVVTSTGGAQVEAWIMRPVGFAEGERYPTLLSIHGGPFTQYGNRFFDEFQIEAGAGFAVVYCNPRGSSGSSQAWGRAVRWPECEVEPGSGWGGVDYDDVMAVIDAAVERFRFVDPDRLGVLGGSYGGYMTSWIVGHSDRFKAAVSERAVNDILHLEHDSDIASTFREYVGVSHIEDPEPYRRQSPITYVDNIRTPLLILHSENDWRCPISQADELFVALRLLRREVEMVRFPGESHEMSRSGSPVHRVQRAEIILEFFGRHLSPSEPEVPRRAPSSGG
jgi:dipeptidyl aminopeptidase/acylaminoacyl peptidase